MATTDTHIVSIPAMEVGHCFCFCESGRTFCPAKQALQPLLAQAMCARNGASRKFLHAHLATSHG